MRLLYARIDRALSCGGLLDGIELNLSAERSSAQLAPICLIGRNGTGKSQLLQLLAEIFQAAWHQCSPTEERDSANNEALFELRYSIKGKERDGSRIFRLSRSMKNRRISPVEMAELREGEWLDITEATEFARGLPSLIVGYTSGDNETLSLPFFVSRSRYAEDVRVAALPEKKPGQKRNRIADNRLMLIDYSTHLEVLVSNLLLGESIVRESIIRHARLDDLASFRCVIQLNHSAAPKAPKGAPSNRKGVQLTNELEQYIVALTKSSTCWDYDEALEVYTFDFIVDLACREAFTSFFENSIGLYRALHKLALLNDLAIPKIALSRLKKEIETRRFASRLPEPQDEDKVFRFEQVTFSRQADELSHILDYVSLSDGEHQFAQILGVFAMVQDENALFLLDEPESHFNPQWRVQFTKMLLDLPIEDRKSQEVLMTTHAPFVPCDLPRHQVVIFSKPPEGKVQIESPGIETFGASFDRILEACFGIRPPISQIARDEISDLLQSGTAEEIHSALQRLGPSVEKSFLADRARQLSK